MTDEMRPVLDLLSQHKITVDEAEQLLRALGAPEPAADASAGPRTERANPRWVRIQIDKQPKEGRESKQVNIRVPIAVVRGGMRLGTIIATFAGEKAAQRMKARGIDLDLAKINGDFSSMNGAEFDAFLKSLDDVNIEV